jgi:hypothetical protein
LVHPNTGVEASLALAHQRAVPEPESKRTLEFFNPLMRARRVVAQPSGKPVAVGIANLLNERGLRLATNAPESFASQRVSCAFVV